MLAGKEYGSGSSRDWAAKGPALLGVRAVIAESYERIHRSNLLMMGILPLQFLPGESRESLGLTGREEFAIDGVENGEAREVTVRADGSELRARSCASTPRASASTSGTAASSRSSCGSSPAATSRRRYGRGTGWFFVAVATKAETWLSCVPGHALDAPARGRRTAR